MNQVKKLNIDQLEAVNFVSGNLLIMASAGTGKTTTIVERYVNMIENHGYKPREIMMTTFTNKAAKDMVKKIVERTGSEPPYIGTMHSLFLRILRDNVKFTSLAEGFTLIDDEADKKKIVKQIMTRENIDYKGDNLKYFVSWIGKFKSRGILAENLSEKSSLDDNIQGGVVEEALDDDIIKVDPNLRKYVNKVYKKYEEELKKRNLIDFDDILILTHKLFDKNKEIREKYAKRFKAIMVDEAQDLNVVQKNILNLLKNNNLCLIGDDCQNIYEWRGSSNQLVFDFSENEKTIFLKENYRSGKNIIDSVNKVIGSMKFKIDKQLNCTKSHAGNVAIESFSNFDEELEFIAYQIKELISKETPKDQIAVLFRTNRIGKDVERELKKNKIPCHLAKSKDFFEREEIKDITAFLKLKVNPHSIIDFERIFTLLDGLGKTTVKKFEDISLTRGCSLIEALDFYDEVKLSQDKINQVKKLKDLIINFKEDPISSFLKDFGYRTRIVNKYREEPGRLQDKIENIDVLKELFKEYGPAKDQIQDFLDSLIELDKKDKTKDKVILSTIHSAKGLEWEHVFLISCNEKTLPFYTKELDTNKRDSELRLFYVAISRAKNSLVITHYDENGWGRENERSHFLDIIE
ncbi:MAG: ATP-dependent helicase [Nanoarchaeota archaeon]